MAGYTVIVDHLPDWKWRSDDFDIVTAEAFLGLHGQSNGGPPRVINLCRRYGYLTGGYYCSLLAEARGQFALPTVADIVALSRKNLYADSLSDLDDVLRRTMKRLGTPPDEPFDLYVYFGQPSDSRFRRLASEAFDRFRYPALRLSVVSDRRWRVASVRPVGIRKLPRDHEDQFIAALRAFTRARKRERAHRPVSLYSLAVLHEPGEFLPPSDPRALENFIRAGRKLDMDVELISRRDVRRIPEFDALFIRSTTAIGHFTYEFACKAEQEGIPVIDDPASILRCTNKVFMNELLVSRGLPTPKA
ncbi:MAG: RimK-like ATPgrasp N-terminal domain-containing protein, partial [Chloroflexi bacterium]|nr:RimK-like ATPgrasp N-terminal domain-containing protein [Chloroflexota bacterium]